MSDDFDFQGTGTDIFWGEISPCEHFVQFYEDDSVFMDTLTGFVSDGLHSGDGVVVIATDHHRQGLERRLQLEGLNIGVLRAQNQYIPLGALETLDRFMIAGWPNERLFNGVVTEIIARAKGEDRHVRAFGEMVAILWATKNQGATVRLEHLWNELCRNEQFSLFCAYPRVGLTRDSAQSIHQLCAAHTKIIRTISAQQ